MNSENKNLSALDVLTIIISFLSIRNLYENEEQSQELKNLAMDIRTKTDKQTKMLEEILKRLDRLEGEK